MFFYKFQQVYFLLLTCKLCVTIYSAQINTYIIVTHNSAQFIY